VRSQEHQQNEANGKDLAEDTSTRSSKGTEKRRERFAGWLGESSGVQILSFASQAAAVITVIVAALTYFWEAPERKKKNTTRPGKRSIPLKDKEAVGEEKRPSKT
jgi:hypothetical protein